MTDAQKQDHLDAHMLRHRPDLRAGVYIGQGQYVCMICGARIIRNRYGVWVEVKQEGK